MVAMLRLFAAATLAIGLAGSSFAQELFFASAAEARPVLSAGDTFLAAMSPFDRAARMKTDQEVSEAKFAQFLAASALDWKDDEKARVRAAFDKIRLVVTGVGLPLPDKVYVIKTSGREESDAAYTRGNAIVLPPPMLAYPEPELRKLLAHELFHIATRANPGLADSLYETIGFHYCREAQLPPALAARKITNPDAPRNEYCIRVKVGGEQVWAQPVLLASAPKYDTARGGDFFDYLIPGFLLMEMPSGARTGRVLQDARGPRWVRQETVGGLLEQVGRNTDYVIQPEEILADNFALLVMGRNVPSPGILAAMKRVLASFNEAVQGARGPH